LENEDLDAEILNDINGDTSESSKKTKPNKKNSKAEKHTETPYDSDDSENDGAEIQNFKKRKAQKALDNEDDEKLHNGKVEIVPQQKIDLSSYELALGDLMVNSKKKRLDLIDDSYHRYNHFVFTSIDSSTHIELN
jgi:hypothetical protein